MLAGLTRFQVCEAYRLPDGSETTVFPYDPEVLSRVEPICKSFVGMDAIPQELNAIDDLPENARAYIRYIEEKLQVPVGIISVGPQRGEELILSPLFEV